MSHSDINKGFPPPRWPENPTPACARYGCLRVPARNSSFCSDTCRDRAREAERTRATKSHHRRRP